MGVRWRAAGAVSGDDSGSSRLCVSVASSVGIGVFLIVGYVAKHVAGPATLLSIVIAAVIAVLSGKRECVSACDQMTCERVRACDCACVLCKLRVFDLVVDACVLISDAIANVRPST